VDEELPEIPRNELVPGDVVHVEAEDRIPVDVHFIESFDLRTSSP
jgi:magnesium-transporting ATPase (P-type)